jgi:diguanylate cyclase (GGDEF)-like protein
MMDKRALVLIVDDAPVNLQVLSWCVREDYDFVTADTGEACLDRAFAKPYPDIILLDVQLPGLSGYETCIRLKKNLKTKHIPIIFITSEDEDEDEELGFKLGAVDYITKPLNPLIVKARVSTHITMKLQRDELNYLAYHDQLTGLYNRHSLIKTANKWVRKGAQTGFDVWLLMIDIDNFKRINDAYGHPVGDKILQQVAAALNSVLREQDIIARFGGEEFVVMFKPDGKKNALLKADRVLKIVESLRPEGLKVTISIGVAQLSISDKDFFMLLKKADDALYKAKNNGRNRVEIWEG